MYNCVNQVVLYEVKLSYSKMKITSILLLFLTSYVVALPITQLEPCDLVGKLIPDPDDCSKFYECSLSGWVRFNCSVGLDFNPTTSQCDFPENVICPTTLKDADCQLDQLKPDPKNCSRFYECTLNGWVGLDCNPGLYFNPLTLQCDYPENVNCNVSLHDTDCKLDELKPDPENCEQFLQCAPQGFVVMPCPAGLYFNPATLLCDYPENVMCTKEVALKNSSVNDCGDLSLDQLEPDPANCSRFIQCAPSGLVSLPCPRDLLFNPQTLQCDYPENVQCTNERRVSGIFSSELRYEPCTASDIDRLFGDTSDCSKFYECSPLGFVPFVCPGGLFFNTETSICDYPDNVVCASNKNV